MVEVKVKVLEHGVGLELLRNKIAGVRRLINL
jgi:hypothetical protein